MDDSYCGFRACTSVRPAVQPHLDTSWVWQIWWRDKQSCPSSSWVWKIQMTRKAVLSILTSSFTSASCFGSIIIVLLTTWKSSDGNWTVKKKEEHEGFTNRKSSDENWTVKLKEEHEGFTTSVFLTGGAGLGGRGHATGTPQPGFGSPSGPWDHPFLHNQTLLFSCVPWYW